MITALPAFLNFKEKIEKITFSRQIREIKVVNSQNNTSGGFCTDRISSLDRLALEKKLEKNLGKFKRVKF